MRRLMPFAALLIHTILSIACAQAPTEKLASAEQAVRDAHAVGAPAYMGEDFAKLQSMLATARDTMVEQDEKVAFLRDYGTTGQFLTAVKAEADRIVVETSKKKEEAKASAVQAQQAAREAVLQAQSLVVTTSAEKNHAVRIKADVDALGTSLNGVQAAIDGGDYKAAQAIAQSIQDKSQEVYEKITAARSKVRDHTSIQGYTP